MNEGKKVTSQAYLIDSVSTLENYLAKRNNIKISAADIDMHKQAIKEETTGYTIIDRTAIIRITGVLTLQSNFFSWLFSAPTYQDIEMQLYHADNNDDIDDALLVFNSPGGEVAGISVATEAIKNFSKPIVSQVDGMCCSGAYYLASLTDSIDSYALSQIGSVGVMVVQARLEGDEGKKIFQVVRSSNSKNKNSEDTKIVVERLDSIEDIMFTDIALGRGWKKEEVGERTGYGQVYTGKDALALEMLDTIIENEYNSEYTNSIEVGGENNNPMEDDKMFKRTTKGSKETAATPKVQTVDTVDTEDVLKQERERCDGLNKICLKMDSTKLSGFITDGTSVGDAAIALIGDFDPAAKTAIEAPKVQTVPEGHVIISAEQLKIEKIKAANEAIEETNAGILTAADATAEDARDTARNAETVDKGRTGAKKSLGKGVK